MADMCTDNRFELIEKYKKKLVEATNIETSPEEMAVLDNILFRFWQMGWLDSVDRMPLVKESARTLMHSVGDSIVAKAFRNAGRFVQNALDGEPPEYEKLPLAQPERKKGKWIYYPKASGSVKSTAVHLYPICSECGCDHPIANYCPDCGADMREGEEDV